MRERERERERGERRKGKERKEKRKGHIIISLASPLFSFSISPAQRYPWVQLAGHKGSFQPGRGGTIVKRGSKTEQIALEELMEDEHLKPMVPLFYKDSDAGEGERFLEMQARKAKGGKRKRKRKSRKNKGKIGKGFQ